MIGNQKSDFPVTFANLETAFLIKVYAAGANRLREAVADLTLADMQARPFADKWTILEILAHTLDSEIMATLRIGFVIAEKDSNFVVYDQNMWAKEHDYQSLTMDEINERLKIFEGLRQMNSRRFAGAKDKDWEKTGIHPELGTATLRNLLELYADHSERHLGQIVQLRQLLDKPLTITSLLTEKLY